MRIAFWKNAYYAYNVATPPPRTTTTSFIGHTPQTHSPPKRVSPTRVIYCYYYYNIILIFLSCIQTVKQNIIPFYLLSRELIQLKKKKQFYLHYSTLEFNIRRILGGLKLKNVIKPHQTVEPFKNMCLYMDKKNMLSPPKNMTN